MFSFDQIRLLSAALLVAGLSIMPAHAQNWPTFAGSASRLGVNPFETTLTPLTVSGLKMHWKANLGSGTETQPLFIQQVTIGGDTHDEVFQATKGGVVFALNAATGAIDWQTALPMSQDIPDTCVTAGFGIMGTPTIDPVAQVMYVVDGGGALHALAIQTGAEMPNYPIQAIDSDNLNNGSFNHSSPTLVGTMLYVTTSGRGACEANRALYHGSVIAIDTQAAQVTGTFFAVNGAISGGGIWGPGGALYDSLSDSLFVGTGNPLNAKHKAPLAISVVRLSPSLDVLDSHSPEMPILKPILDLDFASTPTPVDVPGCPPLLSIMSKKGLLLIYQRDSLSTGPVQSFQISTGGGRSAFLGMAAFDPVTQMLFINNPDASPDGVITNGGVAYAIAAPSCQFTMAWQTEYGPNAYSHYTRATDPTVAGGLVWVVTGLGKSVIAMSELTGEPLWMSPTKSITTAVQTPVTVANGQMFVQVGTVLKAWGL
jgi:outer membrane protein assembly factor BamB